jgi:7,8-dihydropterin-6-yl-methyl-4-(beta-D-ribofuranosyl)aminobenzene 5'-phosphate synthase
VRGFGYLIAGSIIDNTILFDAGERWGGLYDNMGYMGVKPENIEAVVISHEHFDHVGGLWGVLRGRPGVNLYICPGFSREFKGKAKSYKCNMIEADSFMEIADGIYTTGQIEGADHDFDFVAEQALVLQTDKGLTILTGCAHPGIIRIVEYVADHFKDKIHLVMGGFHLLDESARTIIQVNKKFNELGVEYVAAGHCTGDDACKVFKESYKDNFIQVKVGLVIEV